ncbi:MAG: hypothetical protein WBI82_00765 [Sphaerochaeta sp.]
MIQEKCEKKCKNVATSPYQKDTGRPKRRTTVKIDPLFFPIYIVREEKP